MHKAMLRSVNEKTYTYIEAFLLYYFHIPTENLNVWNKNFESN